MGRTVPTYREILDRKRRKWKCLRKTLRDKDRRIFDKLLEDCKRHTMAGTSMSCPDPFKPMVLSMVLEQQIEIESLKDKVEKIRSKS